MGLINTSLVLGKISQVLNEVYELKVEEQARSTELMKQLGELNGNVENLDARIAHMSAQLASLEATCNEFATKTMLGLLCKKVGEIGKTVNEHFDFFIKNAKTDSEFFKLIAEWLTVQKMEDEASAEPKLAKKAEDTCGRTAGNGGEEEKKVCGISSKKNFDIVTGQRVAVNTKAGFIHISKKHLDVLYTWGFPHVAKISRDGKCLVRVVFGKKGSKKVCKDGRIYCAELVRWLDKMEGDIVLSNLYINKDSSEMLVMKFPKLNQKRNDSL